MPSIWPLAWKALCKTYRVTVVVSETTRLQAGDFSWLELDRVRVQGRDQAVTIFSPLALARLVNPGDRALEMASWEVVLTTSRAQAWEQCGVQLGNLQHENGEKFLYALYAKRLASMRRLPFDPAWDATTIFETK